MIKTYFLAALMAVVGFVSPVTADASPQIGEPAPAFTAKTADGETVNLEDYRGQTLVLEWTNHQCPYVIKHYDTGNMQKIQKQATEDGVVWLSIVSSAPGNQGHTSPEKALKIVEEEGAHANARILDESGEIGKKYDAKTTPHMYVIDKEGTLVYKGAIDDNSSPRHSAVEGAENYVVAALDALEKGNKPDPASTQPYGCSVKYSY